MTIRVGHMDHIAEHEQLPVIIYEPSIEPVGIIIHVTDNGKAAVDRLNESTRSLVKTGFTVVTADLFGQGDFLPDHKPLASQRVKSTEKGEAWRNFSGYTYGYNHSLFAMRVHDVLTLIKYASSRTNNVQVQGIGRIGGPIAAAAGGLAADKVSSVFVDPQGFTFASVDRLDHPMFVPGAVKYFDVDGLLSLIAPTKLTVVGETDLNVTRRVYEAAGKSEQLILVPERNGE